MCVFLSESSVCESVCESVCVSVCVRESVCVCVCASACMCFCQNPVSLGLWLLSAEHAGSGPLNSANLGRLTSEHEAGVQQIRQAILQARTRVGNHSLLQGIFPNQGLNPSLLHCRQILYSLSHQGSLDKAVQFAISSSVSGSLCVTGVADLSSEDGK